VANVVVAVLTQQVDVGQPVMTGSSKGAIGLPLQSCRPTLPALITAFAVEMPLSSSADLCVLPSWLSLSELAQQQAVCPKVATVQKSSSLEVVYRCFEDSFICGDISRAVFWPCSSPLPLLDI
jgi:hypothetical protein